MEDRNLSRSSLRHARGIFAALALFLGSGAALSQSLADYAPPGSLLTFGWNQTGSVGDALKEAIAALDWDYALATLQQLVESVGGDFNEFSEFLEMFHEDASTSEFYDFCPALFDLTEDPDAGSFFETGLVSIGFSPFNPMPAFTVLIEVGDDVAASYVDDMALAIAGCVTDVPDLEYTELEQDGVTIHQINIDFTTPIAYARADGVFVLSTSVEQVRYAVRLVGGSGEASLGDSPLQSHGELFESGALTLTWTFDYTVLADLVRVFGAQLVGEGTDLVEKLAASLLTLGGVSGSFAVTEDGFVSETFAQFDLDGGDAALANLLLGDGSGISDIPALPGGEVMVSSGRFDLNGLVDYLQDWLYGVADLLGAPSSELDIRDFFLDELGVDIDAALLGWIGTEYHVVQLGNSFSGIDSLLAGPGVVYMLSATDTAAAQDGISQLFGYIAEMITYLNEYSSDPTLEFAFRPEEYRGHEIRRVLAGPVTEFGTVAFGDVLAIGAPSKSLHAAIDAYLDGQSGRVPGAPAGNDIVAASWYQAGEDFRVANDALRTLLQPLAYITRTAALEENRWLRWDYDWQDDWWSDWDWDAQDWSDGYVYNTGDYSEVEYVEITEGFHYGELVAGDDPWADVTTYFVLSGIEAGDEFTISMSSWDLDTYLNLIELETGNTVAFNDDYGGSTDSTVIYTAQPGITYLVQATSWSRISTGEFTLEFWLGSAAGSGSGGMDDWWSDWDAQDWSDGFVYDTGDYSDVESVEIGYGTFEGELVGTPGSFDDVVSYFLLTGVEAGDEFTLSLESWEVDPYLNLIELETGNTIAFNDDYGGTLNSRIIYTAQPGITYLVQVTSWSGSGSGEFTLTFEPGAVTDGFENEWFGGEWDEWEDDWSANDERYIPDVPSFDAILAMYEILPDFLGVFESRLGDMWSHTERRGDALYTRTFVEFDW